MGALILQQAGAPGIGFIIRFHQNRNWSGNMAYNMPRLFMHCLGMFVEARHENAAGEK